MVPNDLCPLDFNALLPLVFKMQDRIWALWGVHTTVAVAVIAWLISQRNKTVKLGPRIFATFGYGIFFYIILRSIYEAYADLHLALIDFKNLTNVLKLPKDKLGYIGYLLDWDYKSSFGKPVYVCSSFFIIILILIWTNLLLKWKAKFVHGDAVAQLLIEKGIITEEFYSKLSQVAHEYRERQKGETV